MKKGDKVYVVTAHRWAKVEDHSYVVAVTSDLKEAKKFCKDEVSWRGGKYSCRVTSLTYGECNESSVDIVYVHYGRKAQTGELI